MYVRVNGMTAKQNQWQTKLGNMSEGNVNEGINIF